MEAETCRLAPTRMALSRCSLATCSCAATLGFGLGHIHQHDVARGTAHCTANPCRFARRPVRHHSPASTAAGDLELMWRSDRTAGAPQLSYPFDVQAGPEGFLVFDYAEREVVAPWQVAARVSSGGNQPVAAVGERYACAYLIDSVDWKGRPNWC